MRNKDQLDSKIKKSATEVTLLKMVEIPIRLADVYCIESMQSPPKQ